MEKETEALNNWMEQWNKALQKEAFKAPVVQADNIELPKKSKKSDLIQDCDATYWRMIAGGNVDLVKESNEDKVKSTMPVEKFDGKTPGQVTDELGGNAHPIQQRSRGQDSRSHITPNFTCGVELVELNNMKKELEQLESKMNAADAFAESKDAANIQKEIEGLWKKIDKLSNYLNPDFVRDYMS